MDEAEARKKLGIPPNMQVTMIDLDAQRLPPEVVTAGWTDTQIRNKMPNQIQELIDQNQMALDTLRQTTNEQQDRVDGFRRILMRKTELTRMEGTDNAIN